MSVLWIGGGESIIMSQQCGRVRMYREIGRTWRVQWSIDLDTLTCHGSGGMRLRECCGGRRIAVPPGTRGVVLDTESGTVEGEVGSTGAYDVSVWGVNDVVATAHGFEGVEVEGRRRASVDVGGLCLCVEIVGGGEVLAGAGQELVLIRGGWNE